MPNHFNDIEVDISKKHEEINDIIPKHPFGQLSLKTRIIHHFLRKIKLYPKLVDSGFIRRWFDEFNFYWQKELKGRPLKLHDFFYLHSYYRVKFQDISLESENNSDKFLQDWQKPANIYQTFSCAYQYASNPFSYIPFKKYLKRNSSILEYGCGFAPITTSLAHYKPNKYNLSIADIPQYTYHYAKWKLSKFKVKTIDIDPSKLPQLEKYDVIFIITVLEHLTNPLEVIKHLSDHLNPNGFLIFDYIKGEGLGLDTKKSLEQRAEVIHYLKNNLKLIDGVLNEKYSMKTTVVQKK